MHFNVTSGEVFLTDPCYDYETITRDKHPGGIKSSAKNGMWIVNADVKDERDWGMRVAAIEAVHEDYIHSLNLYWTILSGSVGVDSGQAGIFDVGQYPAGEDTGDFNDPESFYGKVCKLTYDENNRELTHGVVDFGVVSLSGFGDGGYDAYAAKNNAGEVVGFRIVFIEDERDDSYEDDYYESDDEDEEDEDESQ